VAAVGGRHQQAGGRATLDRPATEHRHHGAAEPASPVRRVGVNVMHDRVRPDDRRHATRREIAVGIEHSRRLQRSVARGRQPVLRCGRRVRVIAQRDRHQELPLGEEVEPGVFQQCGNLIRLVRGHRQPGRLWRRRHVVRQALDDSSLVVEREQLPLPTGQTEHDFQRRSPFLRGVQPAAQTPPALPPLQQLVHAYHGNCLFRLSQLRRSLAEDDLRERA
jgi:hypothetical protein